MNTINLQQQYQGGSFGLSLLSGIGNAAQTYVQNYQGVTQHTTSQSGNLLDNLTSFLKGGK